MTWLLHFSSYNVQFFSHLKAATVCVCFYCLYCSIQIILHMYDYSANCLVDAITAATYVVLNGSMVGWTNKNPIPYVCKDVVMDWKHGSKIWKARRKDGWISRWTFVDDEQKVNKVWMNENRQITGWMDGWTDVAKREEKDEWYELKDLKSNDSREVFQTALQKSSQQSSRGLASSSSSCLTSAGGQTQVKLLQRRKTRRCEKPLVPVPEARHWSSCFSAGNQTLWKTLSTSAGSQTLAKLLQRRKTRRCEKP